MNYKKELGQVMTPDYIVKRILDNIGYYKENVLKKRIMEPSFGNGAFLLEIIERIIEECIKQNYTADEIAYVIENNVFGIEKDIELYQMALSHIKSILKKYHIKANLYENLLCEDTLKTYMTFIDKFDYVVGNPPYIRVHDMKETYRDFVKSNFQFTKGMLELYVVFYEIGLKMLKNGGRLGYISPNSFMKNTSQNSFRNYLIDNKCLSMIENFTSKKVFEEGTYTCICILDKNNNDFFTYKELDSSCHVLTENEIPYHTLKKDYYDKIWAFGNDEETCFLNNNAKLPLKIKDIAHIQNGVSTNKDKIYIFKVFEDVGCTIPYMGKDTDKRKIVFFIDKDRRVRKIESDILHHCIKVSKFTGKMDNTYILYPYSHNKNGYRKISEETLEKTYPLAYEYLLGYKNELEDRNMEKNSEWFLFARSQGLANMNQKKIVFKNTINRNNPKIYAFVLDEDVVVYSGFFTTRFDDEDALLSLYSSDEFVKYCILTGKDIANDYVSVSAKTVKEFGI